MCVILPHMKKLTTAIIALVVIIILVIASRMMFGNSHDMMTASTPEESVKNYLDMMIPHHSEAVETSKVIMMDSTISNPEVRLLAARIADAQEFEIAQMEGWYRDLFKMDYEFDPSMYTPMMSNPGDATGDERAKIYLKDMIAHHEHAIEMSRETREQIEDLMKSHSATDGTLTVVNTHEGIEMTVQFAKRVEEAQQKEIEQMKELLDVL